jgi:hypothetical protein
MAQDFQTLKNQAGNIKDEIQPGQNTALRIGSSLADIIDKIEEGFTKTGDKLDKTAVKNELSDSTTDAASVKLVKDNIEQLTQFHR